MKKTTLLLLLLSLFVACVPPVTEDPPPAPVVDADTLLVDGFERIRFIVSNENFCNPERGFYTHLQWQDASGEPTPDSRFASLRAQGYTLLLNIYYIESYKEKDLDQPFLDLLQNQMNALRKNGFKVVLRFAYSKSQNHTGTNAFDAPIDQAKRHIEQLKPILRQNADVIAVLEAGFIGAWGEWYYTTNYGMSAFTNWERRGDLINTLLDALPADRMICLRTVQQKMKLSGATAVADTLTKAEAHSGSKKARLAYHNDCFVASSSDQGTFFSEAEREFCRADSKYTAMGGETCAVSDYSGCSNSLVQLNAYHWSYLNINYRGEVINGWKKENCFDSIQKSLGYRFELLTLDLPLKVAKGGECPIVLRIKNSGFAAPYNPRLAYILLLDQGNKVLLSHAMQSDPRFWMPSEITTVKETLQLPSSLAAGSYKLAIWMPDPYESIKANPHYAIRLANRNVWDQQTGYNILNNVEIK